MSDKKWKSGKVKDGDIVSWRNGYWEMREATLSKIAPRQHRYYLSHCDSTGCVGDVYGSIAEAAVAAATLLGQEKSDWVNVCRCYDGKRVYTILAHDTEGIP